MAIRRVTLGALLAVLWATLTIVCAAQDKPSRMEEVVQSYVSNEQFMGSVLVSRDKTVLFDKGFGSADLEWDIPNSPTTKFRLGSLTKQFTAACILLLEERGKLKIDDTVKKYMTDAPAAWDKITIFNLLTHTSGIPGFTEFPDYAATEGITTTPEKLVLRFRDKPLEFQPGEKMSYSNSGYALLGYLIEKISAQTYSQFVQENIFDPLGMRDSGCDSNSAIILHRASGYTSSDKRMMNAGYIDMTIPFSAGGLYSTTEDLARWEQGLFGGKLLSSASLQEMTKPFQHNYAFGLIVTTVNGHKVIEHSGGIEGFNTALAYYPEDKLIVAVLSNLNGDAPLNITHRLAAVAHGEEVVLPAERKEILVTAAILAKYVGVYELAPGFNLVVTLEGGNLMLQATGQPKFQLFEESETKFFLKVVDAEIDFVKNDRNEVTSLMLHQGGRDMKGTKK